MATHDYVIANGTGAAVRSDLNNALAAIVSNNSGSSEPGTTYAYQWWADTNANVLKIRNSANDAWITLRELDGTMLIEDGSASTPGLAFADDVNTGIFSPAADQIGFATGGAERLEIGSSEVVFNDPSNDVDFRVESNGQTHMLFVDAGNDRVGIGTSAPARTFVVSGGSSEAVAQFTNDTSGDGQDDGFQILHFTSGLTRLLNRENGPIAFSTNNSERARIDADGRLLVGASDTTHADANAKIQATSTGGTSIVLARDDASVVAGNVIGNIQFYGNDGGTNQQCAEIRCDADGTQSNNNKPSRLVFGTTADDASSATERMRIDSSGRVGIKNSSPSSQYFNDLVIGDGSGDHGITLHTSSSGSSAIAFSDATSGDGRYAGYIQYDHSDNTLKFYTNGGNERMRVNSFGNFMVGQTNGSSGTVGIVCNANGLLTNCTSNTDASVININNLTGAKNLILFRSDGTNRGSIETNGSTVTYNTTSDYRVKENVVDIDGAIDRVKQLLPKRFNFISHPERTVDGFLAHEAQTVVPEAVTGTHNEVDDDGNAVMQGIDQSKLVPLLTAALQEAIAKIETLETKVAALEAG